MKAARRFLRAVLARRAGMCYTFPNDAKGVDVVLFGRTQEDKVVLFFILLAIYVLDLLFLRMNLKDELRLITHKRVFRHKPKRRIPFFRQFFLLNYIDQFKKRWIWHYVVFVLTATFSALSFLLHLFCIFFHGNAVLEQVHYAVFLICCLLSCLQLFWPDTRKWRRKGG